MLHTGRVILGAPARVAVSSPPVPSSLTIRPPDCPIVVVESHRPRLTRSETVPRPRSQQTRRHAKQSRQGRTVAAAADERAKLEQEYTFHSPGSVQETDDAVVFAHQTPGEAGKWKDASVFHVGDGSSDPVRLGVVIGEFHNVLMDRMLEDARVSAEAMGGRVDQVVWVPGTYEAPLVVERMLEDDALDAVCVVGYIEKGSTLHGQEMGSTCSLIFKQLELEHGKPVGMGIIGPGATAEQAEGRVAYAGNAIRASIRMARYMAKK
tara:strand:+ start:64 stop:858 length:795 start_codon:yes stop_codon:yes gene_type:complete